MNTRKSDTGVVWTLSKAEIKALLSVASKEAARENLTAVHFAAHAVATDGHRLVVAEPTSGARGRDATLRRDALETLSKVRGCKYVELSMGEQPGGAIGVAQDRFGKSILAMPLPEATGTFPPYRQVCPNKPADAVEPAVNPLYLGEAMALLSKAGVGTVSIRVSAELGPVTFCGSGEECRWLYVVMPMRTGGSAHWCPSAKRVEVPS